MTYQETDLITKIDKFLADSGVDATDPAALNAFDQYHAGGAAAVDLLIPSLRVTSESTVLDVGAGFGGPARQIAVQTGTRVVGVDITGSYVETATWLTERCGMSDRVTFHEVDIADYRPDDLVDAALTMHVQMNVADKAAWYRVIADRLKVGGRLAIWEVCRTGAAQPAWPMPWSMDGSDSFLATPDELEEAIVSAGFETVEWEDATATRPSIASRVFPHPPTPASVTSRWSARSRRTSTIESSRPMSDVRGDGSDTMPWPRLDRGGNSVVPNWLRCTGASMSRSMWAPRSVIEAPEASRTPSVRRVWPPCATAMTRAA